MSIVRRAAVVLALVMLPCALVAPAEANLIANGSFETGPAPGQYLLLAAGSTAISGWTVTHVNVHYCSSSLWQIANGSRNIDLDGGANGGVRQTFATVPGSSYQVTWKLAGNPAAGPTVKTMVVTAAGQQATFTFSIAGKTYANMGYVPCSWTFVANSASTTLEFYSTTSPAGYGPVIDEVVVDGITPAAGRTWGAVKAFYHD